MITLVGAVLADNAHPLMPLPLAEAQLAYAASHPGATLPDRMVHE
jgi:hypothetical protein